MKSQKEMLESEKGSLESKHTLELQSLRANFGCNEEKLKSDFEEKMKNLRNELESDKKLEGNKLNGEVHSLRGQIESLRVQVRNNYMK